jgi:hypothetical protein
MHSRRLQSANAAMHLSSVSARCNVAPCHVATCRESLSISHCLQVQHDMLQSLVLLLLVARLLQKLSFQPYISVITSTVQRAAPDLTAFLGKPATPSAHVG